MNDKTDNEIRYYALKMWANYIETNDVNMSKQDMINCGIKNEKILNHDQIKFIERLNKLASEELKRSYK